MVFFFANYLLFKAVWALFRFILDRGRFDLSSTPPSFIQSVQLAVCLGTPSVPHHNFKVLYFIILFNANTVDASYISVSSFRPACGAELAQTGRIITCNYHTILGKNLRG